MGVARRRQEILKCFSKINKSFDDILDGTPGIYAGTYLDEHVQRTQSATRTPHIISTETSQKNREKPWKAMRTGEATRPCLS